LAKWAGGGLGKAATTFMIPSLQTGQLVTSTPVSSTTAAGRGAGSRLVLESFSPRGLLPPRVASLLRRTGASPRGLHGSTLFRESEHSDSRNVRPGLRPDQPFAFLNIRRLGPRVIERNTIPRHPGQRCRKIQPRLSGHPRPPHPIGKRCSTKSTTSPSGKKIRIDIPGFLGILCSYHG
jgi:hypothetical protein